MFFSKLIKVNAVNFIYLKLLKQARLVFYECYLFIYFYLTRKKNKSVLCQEVPEELYRYVRRQRR